MDEFLQLADYRQAREEDVAFIMSAWLNSYRRSNWAGVVPNNLYMSVHKSAIQQLLNRGMQMMVAFNTEDPDQLFGFIAYEVSQKGTPVIHYMFVKDELRHRGFSKAMRKEAGCGGPFIYTHRTPDCRHISGGKFVPSIARRKDLEPIYETKDVNNVIH